MNLLAKKKSEVIVDVAHENVQSTTDKTDYDLHYIPRNYARSNIQPIWAQTPGNAKTQVYTSEQIANFLKNPHATYKQLQGVSNYLQYTSPSYNNILDYLSNAMTFDYTLFGIDAKTVSKTTLQNRIFTSAEVVSKMNVKSIFPQMVKRVLANGECYFYNLGDKNNIIIEEIDSNLCQLAMIDDNNIWRYYINLSLMDVNRVAELPEEIRVAYQKWIDGGKPKDKVEVDGMIVPSYLYLVSNRGFSIFAHMRKIQHDYPYLAPMFEDLNDLESDKTYMTEYIKENNIKLIHLKVPVDKDSGLPLFSKELISIYHESTKEHLPSTVAPLTNPFEVTSIALDKAQSAAINLVEHSTNVVSDDSGISKAIFNAETTNGLQYSTLADVSKLYPLLYFFENFINLQIKDQKCKVKFLRMSHYNQSSMHEESRTDLLSGGSRMIFVATSGIELYDFLNMYETEDVLGFDDMLEAKLNASQASAADLQNANGRPAKKADEQADSTVKVNKTK